jgi:hypothetical protein
MYDVPTVHLVVEKPLVTGSAVRRADACEAAPSALEFREQLGRRVEKGTLFRILFFGWLAPLLVILFLGWLAPLLVPLSPSLCRQEADENPDDQTGDQADDPDDLRARSHLIPLGGTAIDLSAA